MLSEPGHMGSAGVQIGTTGHVAVVKDGDQEHSVHCADQEGGPAGAGSIPAAPHGDVWRDGPALPQNAAAARGAVTELLVSRSGSPLEHPPADVVVVDVLLVTSELVTNAFRHGGGLTLFAAEFTDEGLRITVGDASTDAPTLSDEAPAGRARIGGYGWLLVRRLAKRISISFHPSGKHITVVMPLT